MRQQMTSVNYLPTDFSRQSNSISLKTTKSWFIESTNFSWLRDFSFPLMHSNFCHNSHKVLSPPPRAAMKNEPKKGFFFLSCFPKFIYTTRMQSSFCLHKQQQRENKRNCFFLFGLLWHFFYAITLE